MVAKNKGDSADPRLPEIYRKVRIRRARKRYKRLKDGSYVQRVAGIIAKAQITNGGPIILLQPENEYSQAYPGVLFPNYDYFQAVEDQYRKAGIVVPFISNDARPQGYFAPGNGSVGNVDIYGHDACKKATNPICKSRPETS